MKTIDLSRERITLKELLAQAKEETIIIHAAPGEDYLLEAADDFFKEAAALGQSDRFMSFLDQRAKEQGDIPQEEVRKKRGL